MGRVFGHAFSVLEPLSKGASPSGIVQRKAAKRMVVELRYSTIHRAEEQRAGAIAMDEVEYLRVGGGASVLALWWAYRRIRRALMRCFWPDRLARAEAERAMEKRLMREFGNRLRDRDEVIRAA